MKTEEHENMKITGNVKVGDTWREWNKKENYEQYVAQGRRKKEIKGSSMKTLKKKGINENKIKEGRGEKGRETIRITTKKRGKKRTE